MIEEVRCKYALGKESLITLETEPTPLIKQQTFDHESNPTIQENRRIESSLESAYLGQMFDYYTKELSRLREEKRIMAMVTLTERVRKQKESYENSIPFNY